MTTVVVFGGGGFLGRRLVHRLTTEGMTVRVAVRHPDQARIELRSIGFDRVTVVPADVRDQASVAAAIAGANAVVNTVSAYVEKGGVTFEAVHVQGAETVARETVAAGVPRLVLVSGIGADANSRSPYIRARGRGEQVVQQTFPEATIVRPGAMFGPGDALFGTLAELARLLPILPLIGGGSTRLQPVFVEDVAEAIASILTDPTTVGRTYELAGPGVYTLRELVSMTLHLMRKRRLLIPVPFAVAEIQALLFELLPNPPLTTGQVDLLKADNVTSGALPGLRELNIQPKTVEEVVPTYIGTRAQDSLIGVQRSMTTRPRVFPARISVAKAGTSSSLARDVMLLSFARSRSVARRPQASSRFSRGVKTEFTPASVTSRRMNGMTVVGRSDPWAKPQAATTPSYLICESTLASVRLPSESTAPAQRSLSNGTPSSGKFASVDDLICAESSQIVAFLVGPPGGGDDAIAELVEERDCDRTHPTGSTGHEHIAPVWRDACLFQSQHAKHGGIAGSPDRHGIGSRNVLREPDKPVALDAGPLGVAAVVHLAQTIAVQHDAIPRLEARVLRAQHPAGQVDAGNEREFADDRRLARYREAILIVHR